MKTGLRDLGETAGSFKKRNGREVEKRKVQKRRVGESQLGVPFEPSISSGPWGGMEATGLKRLAGPDRTSSTERLKRLKLNMLRLAPRRRIFWRSSRGATRKSN